MKTMLFGSFLNGYAFWLLLGLALLISEFFVPGVVAVFFGIGALVVGLLTLAGVIDSLAMQLLCFGLISLVALFGLRRHCTRWLKGMVGGRAALDLDNAGLVDQRVIVLTDFIDGIGHVQLNGAKWDAESSEPLRAGDSAWVTGFSGIVLRVSRRHDNA
ncbi:MAG: NfeD family protein [Pseudomonas sp.]